MHDYQFFLDALIALPLESRKMFGVESYYLGEKILFCLNTNPKYAADRGIWVAVPKQHQQKMKHKISSLESLREIPIKIWLLLSEENESFEKEAYKLAELILSGSELIGNIPKPKKRKEKK